MSTAATPTTSHPIYRGPLPHVTTVERLPVTVYDQPADASRAVAREIADLVQQRAAAGKSAPFLSRMVPRPWPRPPERCVLRLR